MPSGSKTLALLSVVGVFVEHPGVVGAPLGRGMVTPPPAFGVQPLVPDLGYSIDVSFRLAIPCLAVALAGCAHNFYRYPGPLVTVGKPAPPVEAWEPEEPAVGSVWDEVDARSRPAVEDQATPGEPTGTAEDEPPPSGKARRRGEAVAKAARSYLGSGSLRHGGERFRYDCSGLVMAAHAKAGLPLAGNSASMWTMAKDAGVYHRRKTPRVGDVAFFANTYDANRNGRLDDSITHVAVVVDVDDDGTVSMVHKGGRGVVLLEMNLHAPSEHASSAGKELNGYLRARRSGDRRGTKYLAGELWIGFGAFWRVLEAD